MTVHTAPFLRCDADGCLTEYRPAPPADDVSFAELRVLAVANGWKVERFNPKAHLCPEHVVSRGAA